MTTQFGMTPAFRNFIRSINGQLLLFGAVFLGAIGLSVAIWIARPYLFEPYIKQKPVKSISEMEILVSRIREGAAGTAEIEKAVDQLSQKLLMPLGNKPVGEDKTRIAPIKVNIPEKLRSETLEHVVSNLYWAWLDEDTATGNERLMTIMLNMCPLATVENLRKTIIVGNQHQQARAYQGLLQAQRTGIQESVDVLEMAERRAKRRGEQALIQQYTEWRMKTP